MRLPGRHSRGWRKWAVRGAIVAVAIAAYIAFTNCVDVEKLLEDVSHALGAWTYLLVGVFAFAETGAFVGLLVPGETVMILGGAIAGQGATDIYLLIAIAWVCAFVGDSTSFFIGRRLGRDFLMRHGPRFGIGQERLEQVDDYFERHGGKTIFIGRFVGFVRAFAPFIAGSSGMRYRGFVPYSILGTGLWVSSAHPPRLHLLAQHRLGPRLRRQRRLRARRADRARRRRRRPAPPFPGRGEPARGGALDGGARRDPLDRRPRPPLQPQLALPLGAGHSGRHLRARVHLADGGPGGRRLRPRRLHRDRQRRPRPDPRRRNRDRRRRKPAGRLAGRHRQGGHRARLAGGRLAPGAGLRGAARRSAGAGPRSGCCSPGWRSSSSASTRSRSRSTGRGPAAALVDAEGSSFPSAHAAYSTFYVWLAVTVVLRLRPGMARGAARRRRRHRPRGADRPLARLPRRPLPQRRQRRLGAGRRRLLALRGGGAGHHHSAAQ